ncbi:hypothetical protein A9K75_09865 [Campylobacter fetus subsp. testudinum]|nr:hypothetical protein A9K75_09865 [Campylobacter fetus subsp. testudinum]
MIGLAIILVISVLMNFKLANNDAKKIPFAIVIVLFECFFITVTFASLFFTDPKLGSQLFGIGITGFFFFFGFGLFVYVAMKYKGAKK